MMGELKMFRWGETSGPRFVAALALAGLAAGAELNPAHAQFVCRDDVTGNGLGATATGTNSTACGANAVASGASSSAFGNAVGLRRRRQLLVDVNLQNFGMCYAN